MPACKLLLVVTKGIISKQMEVDSLDAVDCANDVLESDPLVSAIEIWSSSDARLVRLVLRIDRPAQMDELNK
jgi:hypothetical protein